MQKVNVQDGFHLRAADCFAYTFGQTERIKEPYYMTHIVLDLEWNQKKYKTAVRSIGEIIEIGAVRLNDDLEETGMFSMIVKPSIYPALHPYVREMVHISDEELEAGTRFEDVYRAFREFCTEDCVLYSWGLEDIEILMQNLAYYGLPLNDFTRCYNLQKAFAAQMETEAQPQRSLAWCVEQLGIEELEGEYHRALTDARYTAKIMKRLDMQAVYASQTGEYYPTAHQIRTHFTKFRTLAEPSQGLPKCPVCREPSRVFPDMFSFANNNMIVVCCCRDHGYFSSIVSRRRNYDRGANARRRGRNYPGK